jgi:ribosomal protein L37AE/L43A
VNEQARDDCPICGAERTELVVAPGRFYCPHCGVAGTGPSRGEASEGGAQLEMRV